MDKKRTAFANRICNEKSYLQMELLSDLHIAFPRQNAKPHWRIYGSARFAMWQFAVI